MIINPFSGDATYFPIEIDLKKLMSYAKSNDGSPNSIVAAFMFKALRKVWADNKKATEISARISMNYNADVGCPNTYRDFVRQFYSVRHHGGQGTNGLNYRGSHINRVYNTRFY